MENSATRGLVVELERGVYLSPRGGTPRTTSDITQARVFTSAKEARKAIAWARRFKDFEKATITYA